MLQRKEEIRADCQNLRIRVGKFANTRLVGGEFLRSTTGERSREEGQDDVLLAAEIRKLHRMIAGIRQREVRRSVAYFEMRMLRRRLLCKQRNRGERECNEKGFHSDLARV